MREDVRQARQGGEVSQYRFVEICAGAGGQSLGLELAGFEHELSVELDPDACGTLRHNRPHWKVAVGDVASPGVWNPAEYAGVDLLAGGVPCPPFTIAGKQLGATDERDLFAWAVELCGVVKPRALLLENVRGLSRCRGSPPTGSTCSTGSPSSATSPTGGCCTPRTTGSRSCGPGSSSSRCGRRTSPTSPGPQPQGTPATVGETLLDLMAANGWRGAAAWAKKANDIAPTIVGGSKKHGGADLGPTRAKRAWRELGVDALGLADAAPSAGRPGHPAAQADLRDGRPAPGLGRHRIPVDVHRPQDRELPADRQRLPAAGRPRDRRADPAGPRPRRRAAAPRRADQRHARPGVRDPAGRRRVPDHGPDPAPPCRPRWRSPRSSGTWPTSSATSTSRSSPGRPATPTGSARSRRSSGKTTTSGTRPSSTPPRSADSPIRGLIPL